MVTTTTKLDDITLPLGWSITTTLNLEPKQAQTFSVADLSLSKPTRTILSAGYGGRLYGHQKEGLSAFLNGQNVCLTTGTSSGKSLLFYLAAMELLANNPQARIIAIYPTRALGSEQLERWQKALTRTGLPAKAGRLDGSVKGLPERLRLLRDCNVLVCTPDIIHAWALRHVGQPLIQEFFRNLALTVVDEVHMYTGTFGANAAYLFRRLRHLAGVLGAASRYICASATEANPHQHLRELFCADFAVIGPDRDTSPRHPVSITLATPSHSRYFNELPALLRSVAQGSSSCFIAFVDSRRQAEMMTAVMARQQHEYDPDKLDILPFRSGYEDMDQALIQRRLSDRHNPLKGVIATSVLELGIDIPHLDTCILVGVPASGTSFAQRIGRVICVNTGSILDQAVFQDPVSLLARPAAEARLPLDHPTLQYIHVRCLLAEEAQLDQKHPLDPACWPKQFLELYRKEEECQPLPARLLEVEAEATPHLAFALRTIGKYYTVEAVCGPNTRFLGHVNQEQILTEIYPGAIYYYLGTPYRVLSVSVAGRKVRVKQEKHYTTRPCFLPTQVFADRVMGGRCFGSFVAAERNLLIRESIDGWVERRGRTEINCHYPSQYPLADWQGTVFCSHLQTTGVVLTHPILADSALDLQPLAELVLEAYLANTLYETHDIGCAAQCGDEKALVIFDKVHGLGLARDLTEPQTLRTVLETALSRATELGLPFIPLLSALIQCASEQNTPLAETETLTAAGEIICPGSVGLNLRRDEFFWVEELTTTDQGDCYRGVTESRRNIAGQPVFTVIPVGQVVPVPGVSQLMNAERCYY